MTRPLMLDSLRFHRRRLLIGGALLAALLVALAAIAGAVRLAGAGASGRPRVLAGASASVPSATAGSPTTVAVAPASAASDVRSWNAMAPITPATSTAYPAIGPLAAHDPSAFAKAFATELFSREYTSSSREQLIRWAQYEDAPLPSPNYPRADWSKVLIDSLTDLNWDGARATPIPADGPWLALRSEHARDTVSAVRVAPDPQWESKIASGWQPSDHLATELDVSLTVTRHTAIAKRAHTSAYVVSLVLQLGTSGHGGEYAVAATNNFVSRQVR